MWWRGDLVVAWFIAVSQHRPPKEFSSICHRISITLISALTFISYESTLELHKYLPIWNNQSSFVIPRKALKRILKMKKLVYWGRKDRNFPEKTTCMDVRRTLSQFFQNKLFLRRVEKSMRRRPVKTVSKLCKTMGKIASIYRCHQVACQRWRREGSMDVSMLRRR